MFLCVLGGSLRLTAASLDACPPPHIMEIDFPCRFREVVDDAPPSILANLCSVSHSLLFALAAAGCGGSSSSTTPPPPPPSPQTSTCATPAPSNPSAGGGIYTEVPIAPNVYGT